MKKEKMKEDTIEAKESSDDAPEKSTEAEEKDLSAEELNELRQKAAKADEYYDKMLRIQADLENFRKRTARDREQIVERANERLMKELLTVLDNFELGLNTARESGQKEAILEGMEMVSGQLETFLTQHGVEPIDAVGKSFDPSVHEAIAQQDSDEPAGTVVSQVRRGYKLHGHLLRAAAVVVSKGRP